MAERLFKVLSEGGVPFWGGKGTWPLPDGDVPGQWVKVEGNLVPCGNALHLCRRGQLIQWLGPCIYAAECRGERINHESDKVAVREARLLSRYETWNETTARLFAADCAEHVLPLFERVFPEDTRPRDAIAAARQCAAGIIPKRDLIIPKKGAYEAYWEGVSVNSSTLAALAASHAAWYGDSALAAVDAVHAGLAAARREGDVPGLLREKEWQTRRLMAYLDGKVKIAEATS